MIEAAKNKIIKIINRAESIKLLHGNMYKVQYKKYIIYFYENRTNINHSDCLTSFETSKKDAEEFFSIVRNAYNNYIKSYNSQDIVRFILKDEDLND